MTSLMNGSFRIKNELDVARAALAASQLAQKIGFTENKQHSIALIVSELGKNILHHAIEGKIILNTVIMNNTKGIEIHANDEGPGIENIQEALKENFSTKRSLGLGLPAVKRLTDELNIKTEVGKGTFIIAKKWLKNGKS